MKITLDNLLVSPNEPFYSYILEHYGEEGCFDIIEVCEKATDNLNFIFNWLRRVDFEIVSTNTVKFAEEVANYLNKNFAKCTDLELLSSLMIANSATQTDENFKYYIELYNAEHQYYYESSLIPFNTWISLWELNTEYWNEYFLTKTDTKYSNLSIIRQINRSDCEYKKKWLKKFFENNPKVTDIVELLSYDKTFYTYKWHKYFKDLNPSASNICTFILKKSVFKKIFINLVDEDDVYWFDFYANTKGGDLNLLIYTMAKLLHKPLSPYLEHRKSFLFYFLPDIESIDNFVNKSANKRLKEKWVYVKKELFNIEIDWEIDENFRIEECPF